MLLHKYITILNWFTKQSVPFRFGEGGEIIITSSNPSDTDESCVVHAGDLFYEHSMDTLEFMKLGASHGAYQNV